MLIDWFTVGAQALNFLVLVWLLKRFLYKPILNAIDAREKRIAASLADAEAQKAEALKERNEFQQKNDALDQQRTSLLNKAAEEAKAERHRLLDEARKAAEALHAKRQDAMRDEAHNLNQALTKRIQQEVFAIARKALMDLASANLEAQLVEAFTQQLRKMDGKTKGSFAVILKKASAPALVRSAFELATEQRTTIQNALNDIFATDINLRFETAPDVVCGIEFAANGNKVSWSISDYLSSMDKLVSEILKDNSRPQAKAETGREAPKDAAVSP